jgi:hypothetical protein
MFEVQMLIPLASNAGLDFDENHHAAFETFAIGLFGGITRVPSEAAGAWFDAGSIYRDRFRIYVLALGSIVSGAKVGEVATFARTHYEQLAIYIRYLTLAEIL